MNKEKALCQKPQPIPIFYKKSGRESILKRFHGQQILVAKTVVVWLEMKDTANHVTFLFWCPSFKCYIFLFNFEI